MKRVQEVKAENKRRENKIKFGNDTLDNQIQAGGEPDEASKGTNKEKLLQEEKEEVTFEKRESISVKSQLDFEAINYQAEIKVRSYIEPEEAIKKYNYRLAERRIGSGPLRIGTKLEPFPDIYALFFASCFRIQLVDKLRWESWMKEKAMKKFVNELKIPEDKIPVMLFYDKFGE